jgi:oligopeptidase B
MRSIRFFPAGLILASNLLLPAQPTPPTAKRVPHQEVRHDTTVTDNYFWLRERTNPEVVNYLEAENAYTEAMTRDLKPLEDTLYKEMLGRIKQTDLDVPAHRGDYLYYKRTEEGKQYPIYCRKHGGQDAHEEILLDPNELGEGQKFVSIGHIAYSDDQNLMAYTTDFVGFRQYKLNVKDLRSGKVFEDTYERVNAVEFAADNKTLFFVTEDATTKRADTLWRHTLGSDKFERVYDEKDALYTLDLKKTRDLKYLLLNIGSTDTTEVRYLATDKSQEEFKVFQPRGKKVRYYLDHREGVFYIRTNDNAKDFKVLTTTEATLATPKKWKLFLPHKEGDLIQDLDLFHTFLVVIVKSEALTELRLYDFVKHGWHNITFPEPVYAVSPGETPDYESTTYRFNYQSLVTPPSVYEYNTSVHMSLMLKRQEVLGGYDPAQYVSERQWAVARDGVKIPLSIVYKKGTQRDGKAPMLLYSYGSYGIGMPASFSSSRLSLLDRGMIYAIAHIRGGNEMGEKWHDDGMLMKKKNTFFDFIDSAEYLVKEKWTSPDRLAIEGGSAGGLLMGAVVNLRPDLFRAVHAAVPFVDVMNTMMDASLPLTVGEYLEWGNPNEKAAYDYMKSYSPYDNLEKRASYPALLVTTSFHDSQVMYWEPAKYVARLRTLKTDPNQLLLKCKMDPAGHGGASGRYDRLKDQAFEYAWILSQVAH